MPANPTDMPAPNPHDHRGLERLYELGRQAAGPLPITDVMFEAGIAVIPNECQIADLEPLLALRRDTPRRVQGTVRFRDAGDFAAYMVRMNMPHRSTIYFQRQEAERKQDASIVGVVDHHASALNEQSDWSAHRAQFTPDVTPEWRAWTAINNRSLSQDDLALFLEEHEIDVTMPPGAELREMVADLRVSTSGDFRRAVNLDNGAVQFNYQETHEAQAGARQVTVPTHLELSLAPYYGIALQTVTARLRYRLNSGKLTWTVAILRVEQIERAAFDELCNAVEVVVTPVAIPCYVGTPMPPQTS